MGTDSTPPAATDGNGRRSSGWRTKLALPVVVAVISSIAVTALTPLGDGLRELFFPTRADVSGAAIVDGEPAGVAQLTLDDEDAGRTNDKGAFLLRDVGNGTHVLRLTTTNAGAEIEFPVPHGATVQSLGAIALNPRLTLGYDADFGLRAGGFAYRVTLWILGDPAVLDTVQSVAYELPAPLAGSADGGTRSQAFCYQQTGELDLLSGGFNVSSGYASADVRLNDGQSIHLIAKQPSQDVPPSACRVKAVMAAPPEHPRPPPAAPSTSSSAPPSASPACSDKIDNDSDGKVDYSTDPGCSSVSDTDETDETPEPKPVEVPRVVGLSYEEAAAHLRAEGLIPARTDVESDEAAGTVVAQDPGENTTVQEDSTVTLSVSTGPSTTAVPDVVGQARPDAEATLKAAGFEPNIVSQQTNDPALDGVVLSQDPTGGKQAKLGSVVKLVVGRFG